MSKRQMFKWLKLNGKMQSFFFYFFILMMITGFVSIKIMFRVFGVYLYSCWRLMFLFLACLLNLGLIDSYLKSLSKLDFNRVVFYALVNKHIFYNWSIIPSKVTNFIFHLLKKFHILLYEKQLRKFYRRKPSILRKIVIINKTLYFSCLEVKSYYLLTTMY